MMVIQYSVVEYLDLLHISLCMYSTTCVTNQANNNVNASHNCPYRKYFSLLWKYIHLRIEPITETVGFLEISGETFLLRFSSNSEADNNSEA